MDRFDALIGQEPAVRLLRQAIRQDKVAHAYLISGEAGSGKRILAFTFIQALFCQNQDGGACGQCRQCRRVESRNHPDVEIIEPQTSRIRIDQIRRLKEHFSFQAYEGTWKVGLIVAAETMTDAAANSLLKLLEEPVGAAVLIMLSESESMLLPTIVSRCQLIKLQRLSRKQIISYLQEKEGVPLEEAVAVAGLAEGRLGQALEMTREETLNWRKRVLEVLATLDGRGGGLAALRLAAALDAEPEALHLCFRILISWFRDILLLQSGCPAELVTNQDRWNDLVRQSQVWEERACLAALSLIQETRQALQGNANRRLALDALFYQLADPQSLVETSEVSYI